MNDPSSRFVFAAAGALLVGFAAAAGEPVLRLESHAPLSLVTSTTFGPDGRLFTAGFDKVVRSWKFDDAKGWRPANSYRVPIGPGIVGGLNDVAVSDDGRWLATGGNGWFRRLAGFRTDGMLFDRSVLDAGSRKEIGAVTLYDCEANDSAPLVHHLDPVVALSFDGRTLASLAWEFGDKHDVGEYSVAVWDVLTKRLVANTRLAGVRGPAAIRPAFVLRRLTDAEGDVAVVAAFGKSDVHVWRPQRNEGWIPVTVGDLATCIVQEPGATVSVGCRTLSENKWRPTFVSLSLDGERPAVSASRLISLEGMPDGIIVGAAAAKGASRSIAFVYRTLQRPAEDWLCALNPNQANALSYRRRLGPTTTTNPPRVSISSDGLRAAVASPSGGEFSISELTNPAAQPTSIADQGTLFRSGRFLEKDGELGIGLTPVGGPADRVRVFEPSVGWNDAAQGWVPTDHAGGQTIAVERVDVSTIRCTTEAGRSTIQVEKSVITSFQAFRPQSRGVPFLAVALFDAFGQPELRIYRADTGDQLRRCTGHSAGVTGLAVSADGQLLLSTSADRTVALWNVADLGETIGRVGAVPGIALDDARRVTKSAVPVLRAGDVLIGRTVDGRFQPFADHFAFYTAARATKPGQTMSMAAERNGQRFEVAIPIAQGMDERKPLVQLYFRPNGQWIAWSPFGPYDSNSDSAEEWIGWHFNPEGDAPGRFALGGQYRQQYRRPGLLRRLLQARSLTAALDAWRRLDAEPPDPNISLSMSPVDLSRGDAWIAPKQDVELTLRITNRDFPLERLASIKAIVDGEPVELKEVRPSEYLAKATFKKPGRHVVRMAADTRAPLPRHFEDERVVLFAPPKPTLAPSENWIADSKAKAQADGTWVAPSQEAGVFRLQSKLAADPAFGAMMQQVTINGVPQPNVADLNDLRLPLGIGENRIVVSAKPQTPTDEVESSAQLVVVVRRIEPPETFAPPTIALERVEVGPERTPRTLDAAGTMTVDRTLVRIVGRAKSKENVARLDVDGGTVMGFTPGKDAVFTIEQRLKPGVNRIKLAAKGTSGVEAKQELMLECKPSLPKAAVVLEEPSREWIWPTEGLSTKATIGFDGLGERLPITAVLKRNGVEIARAERSADDQSRWNVAIPLVPGENRLSVDVESSWAKNSGAATIVVVRRPPRLLNVTSTPVGTRPFVDLTAEIEALDGWPATELVVDGRVHQDVAKSQQGPATAAGVVRWKLVAKNVSLRQGRNDFAVMVRNAEGESTPMKMDGLVYTPPPPPRATLTWRSPTADDNRTRPEIDVHVLIESTTALLSTSMTIAQGSAPTVLNPVKVGDAPGGASVYEVRHRVVVQPGRSALSLQVLNEGGATNSERAVNYVPPPATVKILALENGKDIVKPRRNSEGAAKFDAVKAGKQTLVGEVVFADTKSPDLATPASLRIQVNGLQQQTVELGPSEGNVRKFRAPIVLNRPDDNRLFAEVVGLSIDADCNVHGTVAGCLKPIETTKWHMVLIGVGDADESKLREEALEAFRVSVEGNGTSAGGKSAIDNLIPRHVLCGYVTAPTIREAVDKLRMELVENAGRQDGSNVVVFYFRGQATDEKRRLKLLTSEPAWMPRSRFDAGDLATRFADVPGAQLLLLDLSMKDNGKVARSLERPFSRPNACMIGFRRPPKERPLLFSAVKKAMPTVAKLGELQRALAKTPLPEGSEYDPSSYFPEQLEEIQLVRR
jgi:WD40 repeat protein